MKSIEIKNLSKKYGCRCIFEDISFTIEKNEFVALIGPSGSGKSTILNMIGLLEGVDKGIINIFGKKLPKITSKEAMILRRNTINYLFQSFALISDFTVRNNLLYALYFTDLIEKEKHRKIEEVLEWVNIGHLIDEKVNTLSGGEQQRVALSRTILKPGELVLADEPTGSLDPKSAEKSFSLIEEMKNKYNKTIILVTHDISLAKRADRIIDLGNIIKSNN